MSNLNKLDLNLLKVFDAVVRQRSVSQAAEQLCMTQPAVSNALNRLRHVFDDALFVRSRSGMEPTPLARSLAQPIKDALVLVSDAMAQSIVFDPATSKRTFTIITIDIGQQTYIPALLHMFRERAPNLNLRVVEAPRDKYEELLIRGEADFGIGRVETSPALRRERIAWSRFVALLCVENARRLGLASQRTMPREIYMKSPHVHVVPTGTPLHPVEVALGSDLLKRRVALTIPHTSVLGEVLPGTELVASVPRQAAEVLARHGTLTWNELPYETERMSVDLIWHRRQDADRGHIWVREQLRAIRIAGDEAPIAENSQPQGHARGRALDA